MNLLRTWQPAMYHGFGKRRDFFEGWYFKLVDVAEKHVYAVIPGIFLGRDEKTSYSFVQTIDGATGRTNFHRYALADFRAARQEFHIEVGPNCFRADRLTLAINTAERRMHGDLRFSNVTPWPVSLAAPGIMGPYAFAPFMQCYHGVVSLNHLIAGRLVVDDEDVDFTGGRGYTEKDWGRSFPRAWVWLQSNHFERPGTSLTASVATIPWLGSAFRGFIAGLWHGGRLYRFATYLGARILSLALSDTEVRWQLLGQAGRQGDHARFRLGIVARRAEGGLLHGPFQADMLQRVAESLTATVDVSLWRELPDAEELVFQGHGRHAGLEINGELQEILG